MEKDAGLVKTSMQEKLSAGDSRIARNQVRPQILPKMNPSKYCPSFKLQFSENVYIATWIIEE